MNKYLKMSVLVLSHFSLQPALTAQLAQQPMQSKSNVSAAEENVIKVLLESETKAFMDRQYDTWTRFWVQSPDARHIYNTSTGYDEHLGSEAINKAAKAYLAGPPMGEIIAVSQENYSINRIKKKVFVRFTQSLLIDGKNVNSSESRVLEKQNGTWKILEIVSFQERKTDMAATKKAIQSVIEEETAAFYSNNFEEMAKCWAQQPTAFHYRNKGNGYVQLQGCDCRFMPHVYGAV
jgi:hypothetical protein